MSLATQIAAAYNRLPAECKGTVLFRKPDGTTTTGEAIGVPARADHWKEMTHVSDRALSLSVLPADLAFAPEQGFTADWAGTTYSVAWVRTLQPGATDVLLYRVLLER